MNSWAKNGSDCTIGHVGLGALSAYLPGVLAMVLSLGFAGYEALRDKSDASKVQGIVEFGGGYLIAKMLKGC